MDPKTTATGIAEAVADVETAIDNSDLEAASVAIKVAHKLLRVGLYTHGGTLGLTADEIAEIDNLGPQRRSGEPKERVSLNDEA